MRLPGNCILFTLFNKSRIKLLQHLQEVLRLDEPVERRLELVLPAPLIEEVASCRNLKHLVDVVAGVLLAQLQDFLIPLGRYLADRRNVAVPDDGVHIRLKHPFEKILNLSARPPPRFGN